MEMKDVQGKAAKVIKGMKQLPHERQANRLRPFRMGNRKLEQTGTEDGTRHKDRGEEMTHCGLLECKNLGPQSEISNWKVQNRLQEALFTHPSAQGSEQVSRGSFHTPQSPAGALLPAGTCREDIGDGFKKQLGQVHRRIIH